MLYSWESEFLADYQMGDIIVAANTVETARKIVIKQFIEDNRENGSITLTKKQVEINYADDINRIKQDINCEPTIKKAFFIGGRA